MRVNHSAQEEEERLVESLTILQYVCAVVSERCAVLASLCVAELCSRQTKVSLSVVITMTRLVLLLLMYDKVGLWNNLTEPQ